MARPTSFGSTNDLFCARTKTFDPDYLGLSSPVLVKEVLKFLCASSGSLELNSPSSPESSDLSFHVTSPFSAPLQRPVPLPRTSPPRNVVSPRSRKESPSSPAKQFLQNGGIAKSVPAQQQLSPAKDQHALTNGVTDLTNQKSIKLNPAVENDSTVLPSVKQLRRNYCEQAARGFPASSEVKKGQPRDFILSQSVKDLRQSWFDISRGTTFETPKHLQATNPILPREDVKTSVSVASMRRSYGDLSKIEDESSDHWSPNAYRQKNLPTHGSEHDLVAVCDSRTLRRSVSTPKLLSQEPTRPSYTMSRDIDYSKKIHVRSVDTSKVQKQFSQASDNQTVKICKLCERQVFQMEQVKAEKAVWHKNCFRCNECGKQIMLDTYESHEGVLYCKPHYKQLFQPKAHFEDPEPRFMRKKPEMIIRESQPVQLPPDVARASDKVDHGLDELNSVDLKSRFSVFERKTESQERDLAKSPSQVTMKKAEAILSKVARFQTNRSAHLPGSDSESEPDNEESDIIRSSKKKRERPQSFAAMGDVKQKFVEGTFATESAQRREEFEKEKKEELIKLRARLCAGRQARLKEMYEDSVKESETAVKKTDPEMEVLEKARFLKERFEKACGESEPKVKTLGEEDMCIFEAATVAKQSRNLFKELDANAGKAEVTLRRSQSQMLPNEHRRSMFIASQISNDVIRATDVQEDIAVETQDIASRFTFFETFKQRQNDDDKKEKGRFKFTPPRELGAIQEPHEQEVYRDPTVVRSDDKLQDELPKDTAKKALNIFKQMEMQAANPEALNGPKPLKRFTPPPGYTGGNSDDNSDEESEYESEEDEETDNDEDESENDVVKASDKIEDEFLKITSERAMAKNLRNKFERWEAEMEKENRLNHSQSHLSLYEEEGIEASLETTRDLKARFEALSTEPAKPVLEKPRIKVNRFVEIQQNGNSDVCCGCSQKVYAMERHEGSGRLFHKNCFRCSQCSCVLRLNSFSVNGGRLYCIVHYTQNFKVKGNYEEGFGSELASKNWKGSRVEVIDAESK